MSAFNKTSEFLKLITMYYNVKNKNNLIPNESFQNIETYFEKIDRLLKDLENLHMKSITPKIIDIEDQELLDKIKIKSKKITNFIKTVDNKIKNLDVSNKLFKNDKLKFDKQLCEYVKKFRKIEKYYNSCSEDEIFEFKPNLIVKENKELISDSIEIIISEEYQKDPKNFLFSIRELNEIFYDTSKMVGVQGSMINLIEDNIEMSRTELRKTVKNSEISISKKFFILLLVAIIFLIIIIILKLLINEI